MPFQNKGNTRSILGRVQFQGAKLSAFFVAMLVFTAVNVAAAVTYQLSQDKDGLSATVARYRRDSKNCSAIMLGSSVAKRVFLANDARQPNGVKLTSLAYNLQLPSDAWIVLNRFLIPATSGCIIYCVTPRDFYDNDAPAVTNTTTFKRLVSLTDWFDSVAGLHLSPKQMAVSLFCKVLPLYETRSRFQIRLMETYRAVVPERGAQAEDQWTRSMHEYAWRYKNIDEKYLTYQMECFRQNIQFCRRQGYSVLVVNLPLSRDNLGLLPQGFYRRYRETLQTLVQRSDARFADLSDMVLSRNDFTDCAHLSPPGGKKVFSEIEPLVLRLQKPQLTSFRY